MFSPTFTNSEPVGKIDTTGFFTTSTRVWPHAAIAPKSTGIKTRFAGRTNSVATISSPIGRIFAHGGKEFRIRIA